LICFYWFLPLQNIRVQIVNLTRRSILSVCNSEKLQAHYLSEQKAGIAIGEGRV